MTWLARRCCSTGSRWGEEARQAAACAYYVPFLDWLRSACALLAASWIGHSLCHCSRCHCRLSLECISRISDSSTPSVSIVFNLAGEVAACVADVALLERCLLPPMLRRPAVAAALAAAPVVMLDGNLAPAALEVGRWEVRMVCVWGSRG